MARLSPAERGLLKDWQAFTKAYRGWVNTLDPDVLPVMSQGLGLVRAQLSKFNPMIKFRLRALHPSTLSKQFDRLSFEAGLPRIRLHDLRHGAATLALAAGVDMKVISAMLRHSSTGITADIYTSVLPDVARNAAEAVVAMVPRKTAGGESGTFGLPSGSPARRSLITRVANG